MIRFLGYFNFEHLGYSFIPRALFILNTLDLAMTQNWRTNC